MGGLAFGGPGIGPTWASSDKDFVSTALGNSRLWVTVGHGIINELYWPSTGRPQTRDVSFYLIGQDRWVDLKRVRRYRLSKPKPYLPLLTIVHMGDDYGLTIEVLPDPMRDVLLLRYDLDGPYRLGVIAAPHLGESGYDNTAWVDDRGGFAALPDRGMCMIADVPMTDLSAGYVGASDGWQDLNRNGRFTFGFSHAERGNVAISASLGDRQGVIAIGFAPGGAVSAYTLARSALAAGYDATRRDFLAAWEAWGGKLSLPSPEPALGEEALTSAVVLKTHEDRMFPGALVASMSTPWGNSTNTLGGYHLVWPRDASLAAFAFLAVNELDDARHMLAYMIAVQQRDGHWPQNYFPSGLPFWTGIQLDETGFPVLLAAKLRESGVPDLPGLSEMVRRRRLDTSPAADRRAIRTAGRRTPGSAPSPSPSSSPRSSRRRRGWTTPARDYTLDLADYWNERIEDWCYVVGTPMAKESGVDGYYVRIAPPWKDGGITGRVELRNRNGETIEAACLVALEFS